MTEVAPLVVSYETIVKTLAYWSSNGNTDRKYVDFIHLFFIESGKNVYDILIDICAARLADKQEEIETLKKHIAQLEAQLKKKDDA